MKTAGKDVRRYRRSRRFRPDVLDGPWVDRDLVFVWQRHEPFCVAGVEASAALDRPLVIFVPAPVQWEARQWGIRRPGWARLFEFVAERPALMAADVVACGSELVADVVSGFGVPADRILVTPSGVDVETFKPYPHRDETRRALGLEGRFVVGWSGSFRRFHGLELAVEAVAALHAAVPDVVLLLLGDGPQRPHVQALCRDLGVPAVFTGTVPHDEMPRYLSAMDVALLLKPSVGEFHYSPLKLWEYLACGVPVVAPCVGQPAALLTDGVDALLVEPDDVKAVAAAIARLADEPALRASLSAEGRRHVLDRRSWDLQLQRVQRAVEARGPRSNGSNSRKSSSTLPSIV
jgi:glycosyltransferase involved in cell wall biosynthesis